jgi:hypothetical protein
MRIGVTGSWRAKDQAPWGLRRDLDSFKVACYQLGEAIAVSGTAITVGSDSPFTADKHVVDGYLSHYAPTLQVRVVRPQKERDPFPDLYATYPKAFVYLTGHSASCRHTRQQFIWDVDALVTIGGAAGTYQAGLELRLTKKRLVPVGSFGGASSRLLRELVKSETLRNGEQFEILDNPWNEHLSSHVVTVLGANRPSRVLLIHGHAKDYLELQQWLQKEALADPAVMGQEFTAAQTRPEKFERLADEADAAIALATPDDVASAIIRTDIQNRARQNVWVEGGWFWGRLGRNRLLLLVWRDIEIPSNLDGIEHVKYETSVVDPQVQSKLRSFLLQASKRNQ